MFTERDENLLSEQLVRPVGLTFGPRTYKPKIRSGLRLSKVHGPSPATVEHVRQKLFLLFLRSAKGHSFNRTLGQLETSGEGKVGRFPHLVYRRGTQRRNIVASVIGSEP